jgi:GNAT superfamily N-acetyltransferase
MTVYEVRPAVSSDVPALMELRTEAEGWLAAAGIDQWSNAALGRRAISGWLDMIGLGRTWVFTKSDRIVATVSLAPADKDFWRDDDDLLSALYIYKFIVGRSEKGTGLGARILDWVSAIAHAEGRRWVRLDVWRDNRGLQGYYLGQAFQHVRTESPTHRLSGWLGQRPSEVCRYPDDLLPLSTCKLPADFADQLQAAADTARALLEQVGQIQLSLRAASKPVTGPVRYQVDRMDEALHIAHGNLEASVVENLASAALLAYDLPQPDDLAWAAAPRQHADLSSFLPHGVNEG